MHMTKQLTLDDFKAARCRIASHIRQTLASKDPKLAVSFKWENRQITGSFKLRGALNTILLLPPDTLIPEIVTGSTGNHGIAVAMAAPIVGASAHIFVPEVTSKAKISRLEEYGAIVDTVPGTFYDAAKRAWTYAADSGGISVISGEADAVAGAGTVALEWLEQAPDLARWVIPMGGGGLLVGMGLIARNLRPDLEIIGVQSAASPYLYHQFYYGCMDNVVESYTLADGLSGAIEPGSITLDPLPYVCDRMVLVSDDEIAVAMSYAYHELGEIIEGSAAVGLAAILAGKISVADRPTGTVMTGGNIDPQKHRKICAQISQQK